MRVALAALLTTLATIGAQAETAPLPKRGDRVSVTFTMFGCADPDDTRKFVTLMAEGDREAATKFVFAKIDRCAPFKVGDEGGVDDVSVWNNMACVRPRGEPDCRWLPLRLLKISEKK